MKTFCHQASLTKSWNGPVQLLPRVTSLILQATPHWKNKTNELHIPQYYSMNGGGLKSKVKFLPEDWIRPPSDNVVLWAVLWSCLQSPSKILKSWRTLFVLFSPEEIYWLWITCVQQDYISWLVLWSIHQFTSDWKWNDLAQVFICWYRTLWWFFKYWPFDERANSEHPFLQTILNLALEHCQSSDS